MAQVAWTYHCRKKEKEITIREEKGYLFQRKAWSPVQRGHGPYRAATQVLKPQLVSQLAHRHGVGHVLLVGKHQQHRIPELIFLQHLLEFISRLLDPFPVIAVYHKDEALGRKEERRQRRSLLPRSHPSLALSPFSHLELYHPFSSGKLLIRVCRGH